MPLLCNYSIEVLPGKSEELGVPPPLSLSDTVIVTTSNCLRCFASTTEISAGELRARKCVEDISNNIVDGAEAYVNAELKILVPVTISLSLVVLMLTGSKGAKEILPSADADSAPVLLSSTCQPFFVAC